MPGDTLQILITLLRTKEPRCNLTQIPLSQLLNKQHTPSDVKLDMLQQLCFQEAKTTHGKIYRTITASMFDQIHRAVMRRTGGSLTSLHFTAHEILRVQQGSQRAAAWDGREKESPHPQRETIRGALQCVALQIRRVVTVASEKRALISLQSQQTANPRIGVRLTARTEHF